jgi:dihydrofolate reductase
MIISLIAAMDHNRLIGNDNELPWHLPADFAYFRSVTMGKPILMGRKTFESIGRPLPGRTNIVLTRDVSLHIDGVVCVTDLDQAVEQAGEADELMVIGGSTIYEMLLPRADRLYITYVDGEFKGDAWFPVFSDADWARVESSSHPADEKNDYACEFVTYERRPD